MISSLFDVIRRTLRSIFGIRVKAGLGRSSDRNGGGPHDPNNGSVGVGVTVPLKPPPSVLIGKDAKPIPQGDDDSERSDLAA